MALDYFRWRLQFKAMIKNRAARFAYNLLWHALNTLDRQGHKQGNIF